MRNNYSSYFKNEGITIYHEDCLEIIPGLQPQIDLVITDPPYHQKHLPVFEKASRLLSEKMKDNGNLLVLSGTMYLPAMMSILSKYFHFWWLCCLRHRQFTRIWKHKIMQTYKPILWYVKKKPDVARYPFLLDSTSPEGKDKKFSVYQQSIGWVVYYIEKLLPEDGIILDPFMGTGTTIIAAKMLKRKGIGIEKDKRLYKISKKRLEEWKAQMSVRN